MLVPLGDLLVVDEHVRASERPDHPRDIYQTTVQACPYWVKRNNALCR